VEALKGVYNPFFEPQKGFFHKYLWQGRSDENEDIGFENAYFWDLNGG
jgi:hypothetical protein